MIYKTLKYLIIILLTFAYSVNAQVVLLPLQTNPVIEKYINQNTLINKSIKAIGDTLKLPFFDDFSKDAVYPDLSNWLDEQVFVNQSFGDNPPSLGVATFDALDFAGQLHSNAGTSLFISDTLTSKPINLANHTDKNPISISTAGLYYYNSFSGSYYPADSLFYIVNSTYYNCKTDSIMYNVNMVIYYDSLGYVTNVSNFLYTYNSITGIYTHIDKYLFFTYSPADSLYLSFYYQPQGIGGRAPDAEDSLVLEFKTPSTLWKHIWAEPGDTNKPFKQVLIPIVDSLFFANGFQFQFKNYSKLHIYPLPSYASDIAFWNIDYVKLDKNRNDSDTIYQDVTFVNNLDTVLKNFKSVPWDHYKSVSNFQTNRIKFFYRNLSDSLKLITRRYIIKNKTENTVIFNRSLGSENIAPFSDFKFSQADTSNYFPFTTSNKAEFEIKISQTSSTLNIHEPYRWNDTLVYHQIFDNYYAYDDGTPEIGLGLTEGNTQNGKLAFKFYTLKPDTLRGINMFFNRTLNDANIKNFYLTIWNNVNRKPGQVIYSQMGEKPEFHGLNEFQYYNLDTSIFITDTFYIGWIQTTQDMLNIGFDLNNDNSSKVFYNITGSWYNIPYAGTPMMRPVFSAQPINEIAHNKTNNQLNFYPNPAADFITVDNSDSYKFQVFDITGRIILETFASNNKIDVSKIPNGIYILKAYNSKQQFTSKLIINRI